MPSWWQELVKIPEVDDFQELAQKMQASFELPQADEQAVWHGDNYYLAPLAPKCLCQKAFPLPPDPKFPCQDIREEQLKKDSGLCTGPPVLGERSLTHLPWANHTFWLGAVLELREVMEPYISFSNDTISGGVAPLEGSLEDQMEMTITGSVQVATANPPLKGPAAEEAVPCWEASGGTFQYFPNPGWGVNQEGRVPNLVPWL